MKANSTFARNPAKYKDALVDIFKESEVYKIGKEHAYDMLFNFLNKTFGLDTLTNKRRVGYAVSNYKERLPGKDKEIEKILQKRKMEENLSHIDLNDFT